ncbi:Putative HlyD family secretion protein [Salmonella enterica]|nr:Putative HlyD family secretion protein [Salmonella enterica]
MWVKVRQKYRASLASSARLTAEVSDLPLAFPAELNGWPDLIAAETRLYKSRRAQLADTEAELRDALASVNKELAHYPASGEKRRGQSC